MLLNKDYHHYSGGYVIFKAFKGGFTIFEVLTRLVNETITKEITHQLLKNMKKLGETFNGQEEER